MRKIYLLIFFIIAEVILIYAISSNNDSKKEQILNSASKLVQTQYNTVFNSFEVLADTVFRGYINKQEVLELFEKRDREGLYNHLKEDYKYLSTIDFKQIHFHLPTNHSFLRMHKPKRFGDDLTGIRYSVDFVNKNEKNIIGLEMGRVVPGFRYVYPLNLNNKHLGSIETSFSVKSFINRLENVYKVHTHFLLDKKVYDKKIFNSYKKYYMESIESKDYIFLLRKDMSKRKTEKKYLHGLFRAELLDTIKKGIESKKTFSLEIKLHTPLTKHIHKVVTFLVLQNIQKENIGYFVVYQNSNELLELEKELKTYYVIFTILNALLFLYIYALLSKKASLTRKVKEKTDSLNKKTKELKKLNNSLEDRIKEEVEKSKQQEKQLHQAEKMAQMGEMIGNIAHQWRQPLNAISLSASSVKLNQELGILDGNDVVKNMNFISTNVTHLSETIDTFRNFISDDSLEKHDFILEELLKESLVIIDTSLKSNQIKLIDNIDHSKSSTIFGVSQELKQVLIHIINNSKDIFIERKIESPYVKIHLDTHKDHVVLKIEDNGGGVKNDVLPKIFDPYFTTKHKAQGVGLSLSFCQNIITKTFDGKIYAKNSNEGAIFYIELPM